MSLRCFILEKEQHNIYFRSSFKNTMLCILKYVRQDITRLYIVSLNKLTGPKDFLEVIQLIFPFRQKTFSFLKSYFVSKFYFSPRLQRRGSTKKHLFFERQKSDKSHFLASKVIFYKKFSNLVFYRWLL